MHTWVSKRSFRDGKRRRTVRFVCQCLEHLFGCDRPVVVLFESFSKLGDILKSHAGFRASKLVNLVGSGHLVGLENPEMAVGRREKARDTPMIVRASGASAWYGWTSFMTKKT